MAGRRTERAARLEQELFKQVKRRADAQRVLDSGEVTKKAQRICASRRPRSSSSRPGCRPGAGWSSPADGEALSEFVEAGVRAGVERRRLQSEFIARGLRSRDEARRTGAYVEADVVVAKLQRKLDTARQSVAKKRK